MAFRYSYAVLSKIPDSCFKSLSDVDAMSARGEHENFVECLRELGLDVLELEAEERHPDCCKVDDTAVIINGTALMCNPFGTHRQGEVNLIRQTLRKELGIRVTELNVEGANVEGSDVLFTGKEIIVGITSRTNEPGAMAVARAFPEYPCCTVKVHDKESLKKCFSMAGTDVIAVGSNKGAIMTLREFRSKATYKYQVLNLPDEDASNCLYINGSLVHLCEELIPQSFGLLENKISYNRVPIDMRTLNRMGIPMMKLTLLVNKFRNQRNLVSTLT